MCYSMGIFKLLWKTMIRKQLKSDFVKRLTAIDKFTKAIDTFSVNGDNLQITDIEDLVEELKTNLQSDRQLSMEDFLKMLSNDKDLNNEAAIAGVLYRLLLLFYIYCSSNKVGTFLFFNDETGN